MAASPENQKDVQENETEVMSLEEQRKRLRQLIALGKERGYLTYAEINDHLPEDVSDAEQIENIVTMIAGLGIQVYDEAPDADTLLMSDSTRRWPTKTPWKKPKRRCPRWIPSSAAPRTRCACICARWVRWNC